MAPSRALGSARSRNLGRAGGAQEARWQQVANILSRELGGDPWKYVQCLDKIFTDPANAKLTIRDAAEQCKAQQ